ncbi:MAG TPA: hypothetical protein VGO69_06720, partial [Pyrinomonadaceae bacterium]|nr:hypothetical protein [Pyrinomonadaceae bacterium]
LELPFSLGRELQRAAMQWTYVVRNRRRWVDSEDSRMEQASRVRAHLEALGINDQNLRELAKAGIIEVSVPFTEENSGWEARIFPWEYLLSAATKLYRQDRPVTVIRHLNRLNASPHPFLEPPERLLIIESAPGGLREQYSFEAERDLVKTYLSLPTDELSVDETRSQLQERIVRYHPHVLHLTGFDTHQAVDLKVLEPSKHLIDGFLLSGDLTTVDSMGEPVAVDPLTAPDLSQLLNSGQPALRLVSCNMYNSAARICALIVAGAAEASIGFQDEFDDSLTELFFTNFYHAWRLLKWDTLKAFKIACKVLRRQPQGLEGTGVVLWSARSLLQHEATSEPESTTSALLSQEVEEKMQKEKEQIITQASLLKKKDQDFRKLLPVEVRPYASLNYSMLHNDRDLFNRFLIRKLRVGRVNNIHVTVKLFVGSESFDYTKTLDMTDSPFDIGKDVRVPLLYSMGINLREGVHTSLNVRVEWENEELYCDTHRVKLLPIDEWRDDDTDRVWLPSFVQPRDPAVMRIIDMAQRYLMALQDDSNAGFDGYQKTILSGEVDSRLYVDLQVQAIWSALLYDLSLSYINPPPTSSANSQRLRTPSDILDGKRGTCIDLALLLAACLEYVQIHPVVFLIEGHAFPGYWRDTAAREAFLSVSKSTLANASSNQEEQAGVQRLSWYCEANAYQEILQHVYDRNIIPLESTLLTMHGKFREAIEQGVNNLRNEGNFNALVDISRAREYGVTPIPMR